MSAINETLLTVEPGAEPALVSIRDEWVRRIAEVLAQGHSVEVVNGMTGERYTIHPTPRGLVFDGHGRRVVGGDD